MGHSLWEKCLDRLEDEVPSEEFQKWISPLQAREHGNALELLAQNRYVRNQVKTQYLARIIEILQQESQQSGLEGADRFAVDDVRLLIGGQEDSADVDSGMPQPLRADAQNKAQSREGLPQLNASFTFQSFVEGKSNELAKAAAAQVAENAGQSYNPLLIYGGVGLGKTHLMQAVGNVISEGDPNAKVVYLHSQRFVQDMVKALRQGTMQDFVQYYRSVDALLIDDIQFFREQAALSRRILPRL